MPPPPPETLASLGEDALIRLLTRDLRSTASVLTGPGDDCAVIEQPGRDHLLLKTDCVIESVHFTPDADPEVVGWKAAARVVSDFAAMGGGSPQHALVTLVAPGDREADWVTRVYEGIERCGREFAFEVVGGETSQSPPGSPLALISIAMTGSIPPNRCVLRSGAKVGDFIFVSGSLGGSIAGKHLDFTPRLREAAWLSEQLDRSLHAMMDLSDGLAKDLPRLAQSSGVGFQLDLDALPRTSGASVKNALSDGEDYELLFTVSEHQSDAWLRGWKQAFPELAVTSIGRIVPENESQTLEGGWDHFPAEA